MFPIAMKLVPLGELERRAIMECSAGNGGNKFAAARLLGIGKTTLYRKLRGIPQLPADGLRAERSLNGKQT